jgi:hypothetical protein
MSNAAAVASAPASSDSLPVPFVTFKKKGAGRRKEFRAPAQSLASRSDVTSSNVEAAKSTSADAVMSGAVTVEDETEENGAASASAAAAPAAVSPSNVAVSSPTADASDSDDDDPTARPSIALTAAEASAAAAAVPEELPEGDEPEEDTVDGVQRPAKRARKENPLLQSTRNKLKKDAGFTIQSTRSVVSASLNDCTGFRSSFCLSTVLITHACDVSVLFSIVFFFHLPSHQIPDSRDASHQITQDISSSSDKPPVDSKKPKWSGPAKPQASNVRVISRFDYQPDIVRITRRQVDAGMTFCLSTVSHHSFMCLFAHSVRITRRRVDAAMATPASSCTIVAITSRGGNWSAIGPQSKKRSASVC